MTKVPKSTKSTFTSQLVEGIQTSLHTASLPADPDIDTTASNAVKAAPEPAGNHSGTSVGLLSLPVHS